MRRACCQVADYHKAFYRADNLAVIVVGTVAPADVFRALQPIEDKVVARVRVRRVESSPVPALTPPCVC